MLHAWVMARNIHTYTNDPWKVLAKYEKQYQKLFQGEKEEFGDVPSISTAIFEGYLRRWKGDGYNYEDSEVSLITDLTADIRLIGFIDKIVVDKHGRRFLVDHKFHKVLPGPEDRFADIQTLLYFWGYNQSHSKEKQLDGVIWDYGRMKAPAIPELLKNGGLTRRANIDTDVYTYTAAIKAAKLNPRDYKGTLKSLEGKERTFFERVQLPAPSKKMIEMVVEDARATAVIRKQLGDVAPRNMNPFNCRTCDFRSICEADVRGLDSDFVRKRDYTIEERQGEDRGAEITE